MQSQQKENKSSKPLRSYNHDLLVNINNKKNIKKVCLNTKKKCAAALWYYLQWEI